MTDTITESFCERCGTRYSFEQTAKPRRGGIGRVRVLTRGLKNYVANDGMPMTEAMAAARSDIERVGVLRQLDAFHKAFNFCMSCRQYTCANCWNEKAGECLTCAPDLTREVLPAPFPDLPLAGPMATDDQLLDGEGLVASAWPTADLAPTPADRVMAGGDVPATVDAEPAQLVPLPVEEPQVLARLDTFVAPSAVAAADELTSAELAEIETALATARPVTESPAELGIENETSAAAVEARAEQVEGEPAPEPAAATVIPATAEQAPEPAGDEPLIAPTVDLTATTARSHTRSFLGRFRPGRRPDAAATAPAEPAPAAEPAPEPASVAAVEPAPAAVEQAPEQAPEPAPEPASVAAVEPAPAAVEQAPEQAPEPAPEPAPAAAAAPADTVEQPTWRMIAPDAPATPRPDWPDAPAWPSPDPRANQAASQVPGPAAAPWASRLATARPEPGSVWAASSQQVLAAPGPVAAGGSGPAVQACVSCGLSLSANARFCRRCGTRQA